MSGFKIAAVLMRHLFALLVLSLLAGSSAAEQSLEVIRLRHKTADQVLPVIEPLVEKGGVVSGQLNSVFIRASRANREEIKQAIAAIDTPLRRLLISVRQDNEVADFAAGAGVSGRIGNGDLSVGANRGAAGDPSRQGSGNAEVRSSRTLIRGSAYSTRGEASDRVSQQVQTVEGGRAFIQIGQSFPVAMREVFVGRAGVGVSEQIVYRDIGSGFFAQPAIAGQNVTIEISPQQESLSASGVINSGRISTTVSGRLGEWIELGGTGQSTASTSTGTTQYSTRGSLDQRRVLLKVEELP